MAVRQSGPQFAPIEQATLQDRIYLQLRESLISGEFEPGEALPINRLTSAFGTSPMPAREAVRRLIAEGALESEPNKLTRVPKLSLEYFTHLCQARLLLEGWAAEQAAQSCTPTDYEQIEKLNRELEKAIARRDAAKIVRCNRDFHFAVYRLSENPIILGTIETYWVQSGPYVRAIQNTHDLHDEVLGGTHVLTHHHELLSALQKNRSKAAGDAIRDDLRHTLDWYRRLLLTDDGKRSTGAKINRSPAVPATSVQAAAAKKPPARKAQPAPQKKPRS